MEGLNSETPQDASKPAQEPSRPRFRCLQAWIWDVFWTHFNLFWDGFGIVLDQFQDFLMIQHRFSWHPSRPYWQQSLRPQPESAPESTLAPTKSRSSYDSRKSPCWPAGRPDNRCKPAMHGFHPWGIVRASVGTNLDRKTETESKAI